MQSSDAHHFLEKCQRFDSSAIAAISEELRFRTLKGLFEKFRFITDVQPLVASGLSHDILALSEHYSFIEWHDRFDQTYVGPKALESFVVRLIQKNRNQKHTQDNTASSIDNCVPFSSVVSQVEQPLQESHGLLDSRSIASNNTSFSLFAYNTVRAELGGVSVAFENYMIDTLMSSKTLLEKLSSQPHKKSTLIRLKTELQVASERQYEHNRPFVTNSEVQEAALEMQEYMLQDLIKEREPIGGYLGFGGYDPAASSEKRFKALERFTKRCAGNGWFGLLSREKSGLTSYQRHMLCSISKHEPDLLIKKMADKVLQIYGSRRDEQVLAPYKSERI